MRTSEQTTKLIEALVAARAAFAPVIKASVGQIGQNREYRYADLAGILDATLPALLAQGVLVLQAVDAETSTLITRLEHTSGEWLECVYPLKLDLSPQQFGSLLTYGRRYSLQALLCLAAEDDDAASAETRPAAKTKRAAASTRTTGPESPGPWITPPQRARMFAIAKASGWSEDAMKAFLQLTYGIESSKDIPVSKYDDLCKIFGQPPVEAPF